MLVFLARWRVLKRRDKRIELQIDGQLFVVVVDAIHSDTSPNLLAWTRRA